MPMFVPGKFFSLCIQRDDPHPPFQVNIEIGDPDAKQQARSGDHYLTVGLIEVYDGRRKLTKIQICWSLVAIRDRWVYFVRVAPEDANFVQLARWCADGRLQVLSPSMNKAKFAGFQLLDDGKVETLHLN
jgi:hypothetical protein